MAGAGGLLGFLSSIIGWLGRRGHRLGHVVELAVRRAAGGGRPRGGPRPDAARGRELLRRRARQDDLAQNLAIGAAAVGLGGQEGDLFRKVLGWSMLLLLLMCIMVYLQSTAVLGWMVV